MIWADWSPPGFLSSSAAGCWFVAPDIFISLSLINLSFSFPYFSLKSAIVEWGFRFPMDCLFISTCVGFETTRPFFFLLSSPSGAGLPIQNWMRDRGFARIYIFFLCFKSIAPLLIVLLESEWENILKIFVGLNILNLNIWLAS